MLADFCGNMMDPHGQTLQPYDQDSTSKPRCRQTLTSAILPRPLLPYSPSHTSSFSFLKLEKRIQVTPCSQVPWSQIMRRDSYPGADDTHKVQISSHSVINFSHSQPLFSYCVAIILTWKNIYDLKFTRQTEFPLSLIFLVCKNYRFSLHWF